METTWPTMKRADKYTWQDMQTLECDVCKAERDRRARVRLTKDDRRHLREPFASAPDIHFYNVPKYHALQLRALGFAKLHRRCVHWIKAEDKPLSKDDQKRSREALARLARNWLQKHDQDTAGIAGLFPAIREMPVAARPRCRGPTAFSSTRGARSSDGASIPGSAAPAGLRGHGVRVRAHA